MIDLDFYEERKGLKCLSLSVAYSRPQGSHKWIKINRDCPEIASFDESFGPLAGKVVRIV